MSLIGPGKNLTEAHLLKELVNLSRRFPKLHPDFIYKNSKKTMETWVKLFTLSLKEAGKVLKKRRQNFTNYIQVRLSQKEIIQMEMSHIFGILNIIKINLNSSSPPCFFNIISLISLIFRFMPSFFP